MSIYRSRADTAHHQQDEGRHWPPATDHAPFHVGRHDGLHHDSVQLPVNLDLLTVPRLRASSLNLILF